MYTHIYIYICLFTYIHIYIYLVRNEAGEPCRTPSEALDVWVQFFQNMEAGERMSHERLREIWVQELQEFQREQVQVAAHELPTLTDLERALRRVPKGRASGPDGLPGELCRDQPAAIARILYVSLLKTILHGHEPLVSKGGQLTPAFKGKGPQDACSSFRSLLVSNHLGKVIHRTIRQHTSQIYESFLHLQQTGGRHGIPVQLALHQTRAFCRHAKASSSSFGILFLDLTEAFYRILRELPLGGDVSDVLLAHVMTRLKMPEDSLHQLHQLLAEESALMQAGMTPMYARCIQAIHRSTHFWLHGQQDVSRTTMGTRPGDSFADVVFGFAWSLVLKKFENYLVETELIQPMPTHHQLPIFGNHFDTGSTSFFIGPTWMDDLAVCLVTPQADQLATVMGQATGYLLELCEQHCMSPNLSEGKTELLLSFCGRGSRKQKTLHYGPASSRLLPVIGERRTHYVRLITAYKHLGGMCHHAGDQRAELTQRLAIAHQTITAHRKMLFHNPAIAWDKRCELFQLLVLTKFLYGADSWVAFDLRTQQRFKVSVLQLYRRFIRWPVDHKGTEDELLSAIGLPSPDELLRRARLRYLVTLVQAQLPDAWTMLAHDHHWRGLLEEDMMWMWDQLKESSDLRDPRAHYPQWLYILQNHPGYWKRLIRRACEHSIQQRRRREHVRQLHRQALSRLWEHFPSSSPTPAHVPAFAELTHYGCLACKLRCRNKAGEEAHMFRKHQHVSRLRRLADEPTCPACLKFFHTMGKLKAHLRYSAHCRQRLDSLNMNCPPAPGAGSLEDQQQAHVHDRLLPPLVGYGPQLPPPRPREVIDIDPDLHERIVDLLLAADDTSSFFHDAFSLIDGWTISWSRLQRTLEFFMDNLDVQDAAILPFDIAQIKNIIATLSMVETWPFLSADAVDATKKATLQELENQCGELQALLAHSGLLVPSRVFGRERIVLHLFSGRRRKGDVQFYLDSMASQTTEFSLHVVSLDIVICPKYGDVMRESTSSFWLTAIRSGYVIALLAGPPCESWSRARGVQLPEHTSSTGMSRLHGPRIIRDINNLWGKTCVTLRELQQLFVGNSLLGFTILAFLELSLVNGFGMIEHPAEPSDDSEAASIWRLPLVKVLMALPNVELLRFAQGLMGAHTPKPTHVLLLNMPSFLRDLHTNRVRKDLPRSAAIGKNRDGQWKTTALKEYPPAFCMSIVQTLFGALKSCTVDSQAPTPPDDFMQVCNRLVQSEFGSYLGADFACRINS